MNISHFELIIANNRDEYFVRPTKPAGFWDDAPNCISGLDQQAGKEGGTWLALSTNNKIGVLLNILSNDGVDIVGAKKGRGFLVTNFMPTSTSANDYLTEIEKDGAGYNPFNLVLFEKLVDSDRWKMHYYNNEDEHTHEVYDHGIYSMSNSTNRKPWNKVLHGKDRMKSIIDQFAADKDKTNHKEELKMALLAMLNDDTSHMPDPQLESQGRQLSPAWLKSRSAICVKPTEGINYGTRTNTVIIIDSEGQCEYVERTMKERINADSVQWTTSNYTFQMENNSK
ncbi:unnamed protein product [Owenia fusiformis]|uniref:Transport and Golgi organization protein 2 n=1 Tax=Owenia fusiformis TaxID=6347 RepID=A0A8S4Q421_OWEFU|nr:unnamed protein product [Owenia fusiformis]